MRAATPLSYLAGVGRRLVARVAGRFSATPEVETALVAAAPAAAPKHDVVTIAHPHPGQLPKNLHGPDRAERMAAYQQHKAEVAVEASQRATAQVAVGVGTLSPVAGEAIATAVATSTPAPAHRLEDVLTASTLLVKPSELDGRQHIEARQLLERFDHGNDNPGLGTRTLGKGICYLRSKHGVRIFYRMTSDEPHWLAVVNKDDEDAAIGVLRREFALT